jgi:hypothetical protein
VFFILSDGTDVGLSFKGEAALERLQVGPFQPLVDNRDILADAEFGFSPPDPGEQPKRLREIVMWFWHDLSHFLAALGREDLWWACGQLEALRRYCVNLVRIRYGVEAQEDAYEKLSNQVPGFRARRAGIDLLRDGTRRDAPGRPARRQLLPHASP